MDQEKAMKTLRTCISEFISNATLSVSGLGSLAWNIITTEHEHDSQTKRGQRTWCRAQVRQFQLFGWWDRGNEGNQIDS